MDRTQEERDTEAGTIEETNKPILEEKVYDDSKNLNKENVSNDGNNRKHVEEIREKQEKKRPSDDDEKIDSVVFVKKIRLNKTGVAKLVVRLLTPAYFENRFESRETFKSVARDLSHILNGETEDDIRKYIERFLNQNHAITSQTKFF